MNWGRLFYDVDLLTGVSRRAKSFRRRKNWPGPAYFFRALWRRDLIQLTSHLSAIVRCNAPISSGLERALTDAPSLKLSQAMIAMRDDLASGLRIGESLAKYPRFYPAWYVNLIATGESTGSLTSAFDSAGHASDAPARAR